jgi:hypothetical protein
MYVALSKFLKWWALSRQKWLGSRHHGPSPEVLMGVELNRLVLTNRRTHTHFQ